MNQGFTYNQQAIIDRLMNHFDRQQSQPQILQMPPVQPVINNYHQIPVYPIYQPQQQIPNIYNQMPSISVNVPNPHSGDVVTQQQLYTLQSQQLALYNQLLATQNRMYSQAEQSYNQQKPMFDSLKITIDNRDNSQNKGIPAITQACQNTTNPTYIAPPLSTQVNTPLSPSSNFSQPPLTPSSNSSPSSNNLSNSSPSPNNPSNPPPTPNPSNPISQSNIIQSQNTTTIPNTTNNLQMKSLENETTQTQSNVNNKIEQKSIEKTSNTYALIQESNKNMINIMKQVNGDNIKTKKPCKKKPFKKSLK
jgi:hypothetical protein